MIRFTVLIALVALSSIAAAEQPNLQVLANISVLQKSGAEILAKDEQLGVGIARLTPAQQKSITKQMHDQGRCGGFEALPPQALFSPKSTLEQLATHVKADRATAAKRPLVLAVEKKQAIVDALTELKQENVQATVEWLSSFATRDTRLEQPNDHVNQLEAKLKTLLKDYSGKWSIDQITHTSTHQNSLRVHLEGKTRPDEIVVFGAHLDSINRVDGGNAPGADDDASGSASIIEALRVATSKGQADRTLEFFWYAGEEYGLLGSAEIARSYKAANKNVVAVLQLDMTMFPGSGELVIASMEDYTSAWLRSYLVALNDTYVHARIVADQCGYGCSDHASWYRQGFPTLMPFESNMDRYNSNIHSSNDLIDGTSNFKHSMAFAQIALVMAMDLGNSTMKQMY